VKQSYFFLSFLLLFVPFMPKVALAYQADSRPFVATVTAYSSPSKAVTASGTAVSDGVLACPRKYPLGSKFTIEGKIYECRDRLSRKYDNRFDIWKPTRIAALLFGKRKLPVVAVILANPH
jgi:3D (Asp-Asp-Asp) domain-containing protein